MKKNTPISAVLTTNCTIVEADADIQTVRKVFDYFPNQFLPVVEGLRFVGVILRDEFLRKYLMSQDAPLSARNLISKEIIKLNLNNTLSDAKEVFDLRVFNVIPVTDEEDDLVGVLLRTELEECFSEIEPKGQYSIREGMRKIMAFLSL